MKYPKIPSADIPDVTLIDVIPNDEKMISLSDLAPSRIIYSGEYFHQGIEGAVEKCYFRESVGELLLRAVNLLPDGFGFKIFDAWRPYDVQNSLYSNFVKIFRQTHENIDQDNSKNEIEKYVSLPNRNPFKPFAHSTGGAVDITILDANQKEINMGTVFDDFSEKSLTDYYEKAENSDFIDQKVAGNRRLLYYIMTQVGFTNLPSEWWHFDYGDMSWGFYKGRSSIYKGIFGVGELCLITE